MTRRAFGGIAFGAAVGLAASWARGRLGVGAAGAPVAWVADRAAHAVYGLDANAIVVRRIDVRAPVAVALALPPVEAAAEPIRRGGADDDANSGAHAGGAAGADSGADAGASAGAAAYPDGSYGGAHDGASGVARTIATSRAGPAVLRVVSAIDARPDGRFELLDLDGVGRVLGARACEAPRRVPPARWAAAFESRNPARMAWCEQRRGARRLLWVARPVEAGAERAVLERWVERDGGARRVFRRTVPGAVGHLVGDRAGEVDFVGARRLVVTRIDGAGRMVRIAHHADAEGASAAVRDRSGAVWIAARGALVRVDRSGTRRPGQGGFAELVDVGLALGCRAPTD